MKLRNAAALAIVGGYLMALPRPPIWAGSGWYLLEPFVRKGVTDEEILRDNPNLKSATVQQLHDIAPAYMGDWDAPLDAWIHAASFDTAADCEAARLRLVKAAKAAEPEFRRKYPNGYPTLETTLLLASRCIATDDPRLKSK
jgi:hypothetical protein